MSVDTALRNSISSLQKANQFHKRPHLLGRWCRVVEITNKADSYAVLIGPITGRPSAMGAGHLSLPAECRFDLTIPTVGPVADNKMVADPFPLILFSVYSVKDGSISIFCCRMMDHYGRPIPLHVRRRQPVPWNTFVRHRQRRPWRDNFRRGSFRLKTGVMYNLGHRLVARHAACQNEQTTTEYGSSAIHTLSFSHSPWTPSPSGAGIRSLLVSLFSLQ